MEAVGEINEDAPWRLKEEKRRRRHHGDRRWKRKEEVQWRPSEKGRGGASRRLKAEKRSRSYPEYRKYIKKGGGSMEAEGGERKEGVQ
jgi:hypothetical protein